MTVVALGRNRSQRFGMHHELFSADGPLWKILFLAWPPVIFVVLLKLFPDFASKAVLSVLEQRHRRSLTQYKDMLDRDTATIVERTKGQIQADHSTLKATMDFMAASQSRLREHTIGAVQVLWSEVLTLRDVHANLATFETMFLDDEIAEAFSERDGAFILGWVAPYADEDKIVQRNVEMTTLEAEKHRPFCGDRLWLIFVVLRSVYFRSAILVSWAFKKGVYTRMLDDTGIQQLLSGVVAPADVAALRQDRARGFNQMLGRLEAMFLEEAARVMSGSEAFAASLIDLSAGLQIREKTSFDGRRSAG